MEASRDDFIIAIRSSFLKKENKQRFSLLFLIFLSIIFLILGRFNFQAINYLKIGIKEIVYRSSFIVSTPENYIKNTYFKIQDHFILYKEFSEIKSELKNLQSKKVLDDFVIKENERLKKIVDDYVVSSDEIVAKILIDKESPFLKSFVVNKGSKDNIMLGMSVLDGHYLVGKVVEVNYLSSRILLLSDLNSKIPVIIEPGGIQSILSGTGENDGIIQYFKGVYDIDDGSIIYTSGSGGLFKAGIPIGKFRLSNSIEIDDHKIEFYSDFSQLKFVKIVSFEKGVN
tara:strand:+ start:1573 stop:2427 length:855 start_codon:yes stop_codon:yes gene_type:complete